MYKFVWCIRDIKPYVSKLFLAPTGELYELLCYRGRLGLGLLLLLGGGKITFLLGNWIPFIRFGQKLALSWSLTLKTSLRENFFIFLKIQDDRLRSKVQNLPNLTPQITFRLRHLDPVRPIWIKNLAWTY